MRPQLGMTMIEVLVALLIGMILMVAIGSAMSASSSSIRVNQDFVTATRVGQMALRSISTAARISYLCDVEAGAAAGDSTAASNVLYITPMNSAGVAGARVAYIYDSDNKMLLLDSAPPNAPIDSAKLSSIRSRMIGTSPTVFSLAANIGAASFVGYYDERESSQFAVIETRLVNLQIRLKVDAGTSSLEMCESVIPRTSYQQ